MLWQAINSPNKTIVEQLSLLLNVPQQIAFLLVQGVYRSRMGGFHDNYPYLKPLSIQIEPDVQGRLKQ